MSDNCIGHGPRGTKDPLPFSGTRQVFCPLSACESQLLTSISGSSAPQTTAPTPSNVQVLLPEQNGPLPDSSQKPVKPNRNSTRPQRKGTKTNSISRLLNKNETPKDGIHHDGEALPEPSPAQAQVTPFDEDLNPRRKRRRLSAGDLDWEPRGLTKNEVGCPLQLNPNPGSSPSRQQSEGSPNRGSAPFSSEGYQSKARPRKLLPKPTQDLPATEPFLAPQSELTEGIQRETYQSSPGEQPNGIPQPNLLTPDSIKHVHSDTEVTGLDNGEPGPQKKTLKLNSNGKLLSPTSEKPRSQSPGRKRGRPKKASKKRLSNVSPVIIKYPVGEVGRERFGGLINDISNGLTRYPPPRAPSQPAVSQKPSKPTHPFFLGKASDQPNNPVESSQQVQSSAILIPKDKPTPNPTHSPKKSTPAVNIVQPNRPNTKHRSATSGPVFPTKPRLSRGSNLMEALWPPRDFSHISAAQGITNRQLAANAKLVNNAEKKGKSPLLGIPDSESILYPLSQLAREFVYKESTLAPSATNDILRRPERYVADGETLQSLVADELSFNSARQPPQETSSRNRTLLPDKGCHPAILRLASLIPTSWTAFDNGEFDVLPWTLKYAPGTAEDVLQPGPEVLILRDWLRHLMVSTVDTGNTLKDGSKPKQSKSGRKSKRNKKRKLANELDGFIVSSEDEASQPDGLSDPDEDELSGGVTFMSKRSLQPNNLTPNLPKARGQMWNAVLISGPSGCGKTASVYAAAKELDFEVFELNSGSRRSAKDILDRVGDMTRNHLVHKLNGQEPGLDSDTVPAEHEFGKQSRMNNFFQSKPTTQEEKKTKIKKDNQQKTEPQEPKRQKTQKQSLILLEEVDVLFEEDKQFWSGVLSLINQSKRPIVMTCRDEGLLPFDDLSFHTILRYSHAPCSLAVDFMLLLAAREGHLLQRKAVSDLYIASNQDLRASITELNFWCQMALGSQKSGIDWMIGNFRRPVSLSDRQRVISKNTYLSGMGWYSRDMACCQGDEVERETSLMTQCMEQWPMEIMDWQETMTSALAVQGFEKSDNVDTQPDRSKLESLERKSEFTDMQSLLDLLSWTESKETTNVRMLVVIHSVSR